MAHMLWDTYLKIILQSTPVAVDVQAAKVLNL